MWTLILSDPQGQELRRVPLRDRPLTIGRSRDCDLGLDSKAASRQHAQIEARGASAILIDLGSANGTLLNGKRLEKPTALAEGDEVRIAEFSLRLQREVQPAPLEPQIQPPTQAAMQAAAQPQAPAAERRAGLGFDAGELPPIRIPEPAPAAAAVAPPPAEGWNSASQLLDEQLRSIRSFREEARKEPGGKLESFEQEWDKVIVSMRDLQQQLQGNPRVLLFSISRNSREVTAKIVDPDSKRGHMYLILSPEHPEGKFRDQRTVWLREFGEADSNFEEPREAMRYFVKRIAGKLA
jgi:hypothetical protein